MSQSIRAQVVMSPEDAGRFDAVWRDDRHMQSTLVAWLIYKFLGLEDYGREALRWKSSA